MLTEFGWNFLNDIRSRHSKIVLAGDFNLPRVLELARKFDRRE
jgi:hypothetical protein